MMMRTGADNLSVFVGMMLNTVNIKVSKCWMKKMSLTGGASMINNRTIRLGQRRSLAHHIPCWLLAAIWIVSEA